MGSLHDRYSLTPVINLSGPLTIYGTGQSSPTVAAAAADALQQEWLISELYQRASEKIARWSGADAGSVTACSASGISVTVAACMTGNDLGKVRQLPDTTGMKNQVVIQKGHSVQFGAPIEQMIRLAGATVREVGTVNQTALAELRHALTDQTAAAVFVVSHHTMQHGFIQLDEFVQTCHEQGVPVIVDGAAQAHQVERLVESGADLIVISGQKYLDAPTSGIVCGPKDLVEAVTLQNQGIGRAMKVGKEGIIGAIVAIEERMATDLDTWAAAQREKAAFLASRIEDIPSIRVSLVRDQPGQPVTRVRIELDPDETALDAATVCSQLQDATPTIRPRGHHTDEGWFLLEPNHASEEELTIAAERLRTILAGTRTTASV